MHLYVSLCVVQRYAPAVVPFLVLVQSSSVSCLSYKVQLAALSVHSSLHRALEPLLQLGHDEHAGRERHQKDQIHRREGLRLEYHLQWGEIDHQELAEQGEADGRQEHPVGEEANLKNALGLRSTAQRVPHVKQDEAGEGHGGIPARYSSSIGHLALEYP